MLPGLLLMSGAQQPADAAPMADAQNTIAEVGILLSDLARRWSGRRVRAMNGYRQILSDYYTGHTDARSTASAVARLTAKEVARYPGELVDLATDYATGLARTALLAEPGATLGRETITRRAVHDLQLSGKVGETVATSLVIENPRDRKVTVGFAAAAFANESRVIKLTPGFDPASCALVPGAEQRIAVTAKLDGRLVKPGESFTSQAVVDGFDDLVLRIHLNVDAA